MVLEYLSHRQVNIPVEDRWRKRPDASINQTPGQSGCGLTLSPVCARCCVRTRISSWSVRPVTANCRYFGSCGHHRSSGAEYAAYQHCGLEHRPSGRYGHRPLSDRKFAGRSGRAARCLGVCTAAEGHQLRRRARRFARQGYHDHQARHRLVRTATAPATVAVLPCMRSSRSTAISAA